MNKAQLKLIWRSGFIAYFAILSWQLLTPVTVVDPGSWDKLIHFSGFFVLGVLAMLSSWQLAVSRLGILLIIYAALTEILQHFIPGRGFSIYDWLADALGIIVALILMGLIYSRADKKSETLVVSTKYSQ